MSDNEMEPITVTTLSEQIAELDNLPTAAQPRSEHLLADLAVNMLGCQVYAHAYAVCVLGRSDIPDSAYPSARAAFEAAEDLVILALAPTDDEFDELGAKAYVSGEIATAKVRGLTDQAAAVLRRYDLKRPATSLKEAVELGIRQWEPARPDAREIVDRALQEVRASWDSGTKHWSGQSRNELHELFRKRLADRTVEPVTWSWYDHLAYRSHPALHWPPLKLENGKLHFVLRDSDSNPDPIPVATAYWSIGVGIAVFIEVNSRRVKAPGRSDIRSGA